MVHSLKTLPEYFEQVYNGNKNFEIRKNDRNFQVGDFLELKEFDPTTGYTGRESFHKVTYIFKGGMYGLDPDFVCLSLGCSL